MVHLRPGRCPRTRPSHVQELPALAGIESLPRCAVPFPRPIVRQRQPHGSTISSRTVWPAGRKRIRMRQCAGFKGGCWKAIRPRYPTRRGACWRSAKRNRAGKEPRRLARLPSARRLLPLPLASGNRTPCRHPARPPEPAPGQSLTPNIDVLTTAVQTTGYLTQLCDPDRRRRRPRTHAGSSRP